MTLDLAPLRDALADRDAVARVVVVGTRGSAPRDAGASMLVWDSGQIGTIGGGALEWEAAAAARAALNAGRGAITHHPLGPDLGQCCGGSVSLATEIWTAQKLHDAEAAGAVYTRRVAGELPMPAELSDRAETGTAPCALSGWLREPLQPSGHPLWIWGAGHVGRALVSTFTALPDWDITWADIGPDRFPAEETPGVTGIWSSDMPRLAAHAPLDAMHLIVTHSHPLDLALCDALLHRGFAFCGLIGSDTKKARFKSRLIALGHGADDIARITCPIGERDLGKHPAQIALGVALHLERMNDRAHLPGQLERTGT